MSFRRTVSGALAILALLFACATAHNLPPVSTNDQSTAYQPQQADEEHFELAQENEVIQESTLTQEDDFILDTAQDQESELDHESEVDQESELTSDNAETLPTETVKGQLGLFIHEFEDDQDLEYCLLTPEDPQQAPMMIELDQAFDRCHQGLSGVFTLAPHTGSSLDKNGCDARFAPLCVESSFELKSVEVEEQANANKQNTAENKVSGARSILFVQMSFVDKSSPCDKSCIQRNMWTSTFNVDGLYNEASFGALRFPQSSSTIVELSMGTRTSDYDYCASNGPQKLRSDALAKLAQQYPSVSPSSYDHFMMVTPALCGIGVSQVGGSLLWVNSDLADVFAHELAHNLGRRHASIDMENSDPSSLASYPAEREYADKSCITGERGIGLRSFNLPNRIHLGWIPSSAIVTPPASCATTAMVYTLASAHLAPTQSSSYHTIRIPRAQGGFYYVSYRTDAGYDVNLPQGWKNAVLLHYAVSETSRTKLVSVLAQVNGAFHDEFTGFGLRVLSMGSKSAQVRVYCGKTSAASCSLDVTTDVHSKLTGTYYPTSTLLEGQKTWALADQSAVIAYCASQSVWVVGSHDDDISSFQPCSDKWFKSTPANVNSPTDVEAWEACTSSLESSCAQDTSATVTLNSCSGNAPAPVPSRSPSPSPVPPAPNTNNVCYFFVEFCDRCQQQPNPVCSYLSDLCTACA